MRVRDELMAVADRNLRQTQPLRDEAGIAPQHDVDIDQIIERLHWTPKQRLDYLLDILAFEERARRARRVS